MSRFTISDSARPGTRIPGAEYRTTSGRTSDVLNEAQAIARQRKQEKTLLHDAAFIAGGTSIHYPCRLRHLWHHRSGVAALLGNP